MTQVDLTSDPGPVAGIADVHQSTVTAIRHAAGQGRFTEAKARLLIDRVRAHAITATSSSIEDSQSTARTRRTRWVQLGQCHDPVPLYRNLFTTEPIVAGR